MKWVERTPKVKIHNEKHGASHSGDVRTGCTTYIAIQKAGIGEFSPVDIAGVDSLKNNCESNDWCWYWPNNVHWVHH